MSLRLSADSKNWVSVLYRIQQRPVSLLQDVALGKWRAILFVQRGQDSRIRVIGIRHQSGHRFQERVRLLPGANHGIFEFGITQGHDVPNAAERKVMLDYLLEYALEVSRSELPRGPGRALFVTNCSRCHELPDPSQHTETDWAAVVIRMRQHMVQMLRLSPPQAEVQEIILYLERASKAAS